MAAHTQFNASLAVPSFSARMDQDDVASALARLIVSGAAVSKADLGRATGLSRTTIDAAVERLIRLNAIKRQGLIARPGRGRPGEFLSLNTDFCLVLMADCGSTHASLSVLDLSQTVLAHEEMDFNLESGVDKTLNQLATRFLAMLAEIGMLDIPRRLVIGLPGVIDQRKGWLHLPPWDGFPIVSFLADLIGGPVHVENDVRLRALGEARVEPPDDGPIVYMKIGTGVGMAVVLPTGEVLSGMDSAAGEIGHMRVPDSVTECTCGRQGCLEANASMPAVAKGLGVDTTTDDWADRVAELIRERDPRATQAVKHAADAVGEILVGIVHVINPSRLVIGGRLSAASDQLLAGIRSVVYEKAMPLSTRNLVVKKPVLGASSGVVGGFIRAVEAELSADSLAARSKPVGRTTPTSTSDTARSSSTRA